MGETKPLIVVTTSEMRPGGDAKATPQGEPQQLEMALGLRYLQAIERAGGVPVVAPPLAPEAAEALLECAAGVCLSGGPDLDPVAYGQRIHPQAGPMWPALDEFELAFARAADARGLPVLAICRGMQVLNVARGGTLHQHLPDVVGEAIRHRQDVPGDRPTHPVSLLNDARLTRILGSERDVNSFHHQGVDRLGRGLVVAGRAPDGTIEALEAEDRDFMLGVQWHAETLPADGPLFEAFVTAARRARQARTTYSVAA